MQTQLPQSIKTIEQAKQLLTELYRYGESFHPEDDARELSPELFTQEEGLQLNRLMDDIYNLPGNDGKHDDSILFCPCGFLLELAEPTVIPDNWKLYDLFSDEAKALEDFSSNTEGTDAATGVLISDTRYWILVHKSGKYSTEIMRESAYGRFKECLELIESELGEKRIDKPKTDTPDKYGFFSDLATDTWDNLEVHPVWEDPNNPGVCEVCEPDQASFWSVYYHSTGGGVVGIADLPTEKAANDLHDLIKNLVTTHNDKKALLIIYSIGESVDKCTDHYEAFRAGEYILDGVIRRYEQLAKQQNIYSISLAEVIKSTDY